MNALIITDTTAVRMNVIAERTQNLLMAGAKAMMIQSLKEKLSNGVAHFIFVKKNGEIREAFGTTNSAVASNTQMAMVSAESISRPLPILILRRVSGEVFVGNLLLRCSKYGREYYADSSFTIDGSIQLGFS